MQNFETFLDNPCTLIYVTRNRQIDGVIKSASWFNRPILKKYTKIWLHVYQSTSLDYSIQYFANHFREAKSNNRSELASIWSCWIRLNTNQKSDTSCQCRAINFLLGRDTHSTLGKINRNVWQDQQLQTFHDGQKLQKDWT